MADLLSPQKRSWNMSRIKGKDTSIEVKVRKYLFKKGLRYRKNMRKMPGKPDIVLPKYKTVIFVHGCFWHRHKGCPDASIPKTRTEFWLDKFKANEIRDNNNMDKLKQDGWKIIVIWECQVNSKSFEDIMNDVYKQIIN